MKFKSLTGKYSMPIVGGLIAMIALNGCHKNLGGQNENLSTGVVNKTFISLPFKTNPLSLQNVLKAKATLAAKNAVSMNATALEDYPKYTYFKFDPSQISQEDFMAMENDTTVRLLDFPFANGAIYNDSFALDETKANQLKDGNIYGIVSSQNTPILNRLAAAPELTTTFLDTLALIPEEDTATMYQAFREAGTTEAQLDLFRICLFKRPTGHVRYFDGEYRRSEPVRNIQVWGLVFGIPLSTYTDNDGYYRFPWRFSFGTIMGTHAKNSRVNIKPFNTMGGFFQVIPQLIVNFLVGSVHIKGWVSPCAMRSDVDFDFNGHTQAKYWSQLLNAYYFHDQYAAQDGISSAPQSMVCYAHWADARDFGSASTPMLYHLTGGQFTDQFINWFFVNRVTGTLLRIIHGLLPDMTFKVCGGSEPDRYSSRLAQIAFHELGHASMFRRVGPLWHLALATAELSHVYGDPGYNNWGKVQVAESWAEFIGTDNAFRRYPNGVKNSAMLGYPTSFSISLEYEEWYAEPTRWIPCGIYFDLIDQTNNLAENWDMIGGSNIQEMYNVFYPSIEDMCEYRDRFIMNNPQYNQANVRTLFDHYNLNCKL